MSRQAGPAAGRFPGFDSAGQAWHWDQVTAEVVAARSGPFAEMKFFTAAEQACAAALLNLLTGTGDRDGALGVPAAQRGGTPFAEAAEADQHDLVQAVQDTKSGDWHGLPATQVWSLWTRYACTAFYAHPFAWNEIGFPGPAYPRGYKNAGVGKLEPFEVADALPSEDPVRKGA